MTVKIGDKYIGRNNRCFLSAEAGTTCNGDLNMAKELADAVREAGMDAIKFQTVDPEQISDKNTVYRYQTVNGWVEENMYELLKNMSFAPGEWHELADYVRSRGLVFFSTVDYLAGVDLLESCAVPVHKMGSWDIQYEPLIKKIAATGKPVMIDLGPAGLSDIARFIEVYSAAGGGRVIPLHDFHTSAPDEMHMRNIAYLKDVFHLPAGFSSPGRDDDLDIVAVALGADVIEKRITLSRSLPGHHHYLSLEPGELKQWVERVRRAEAALGTREIRPSQTDLDDSKKYFKSICATRAVRRGEIYSMDNLDGKRPGTGIPTRYLEHFLGKRAPRDLAPDTLLTWKDLGLTEEEHDRPA